jgi:hypothetical protein
MLCTCFSFFVTFSPNVLLRGSIAYRAGVTVATSSPHAFFIQPTFIGLSTTFRTGAPHALAEGAVIQRISALHCAIRRPNALALLKGHPSISARIAVLRRLLLGEEDERAGETAVWFSRAAEGALPLIVDVGSADVMAVLLRLKDEVERKRGTRMRLVFSGAAEAHLLAKEIGRCMQYSRGWVIDNMIQAELG